MSSLKNKECKEYNTLKYKTMIMTGQNIDTPIQNETNAEDLDSFLMNEMNENKKQPWNKLSKTDKIKKLKLYIQNTLTEDHQLNEIERQTAQRYILSLLDRKKITKNAELDYDEQTGVITKIHILLFNPASRNFTLNKEFKKKSAPKSKTIKKVKPKPKETAMDTSSNKIENEIK